MNLTEREEINIVPGNIPGKLKDLPQWICWKADQRNNGKTTKIPINPLSGKYARTNDPKTWGQFKDAEAFYRSFGSDGIGFVFTEHDPFVGIDIDGCIDPDTGEMDPGANQIVKHLGSYTEISPTGCGVHIIVEGKLPGAGRNTDKIEIYDEKRYFTFTGNLLNGSSPEIEHRDAELKQLYGQLPVQPEKTLEDQIIEKARKARNGEKFMRLWGGDYFDYPSRTG